MEWMAWTPPTALFFIAVALTLVGMTIWDLKLPAGPRKGFLPIETTRGDRLFISLLGSAFIHLAWVGLTEWNLAGAAVISLVYLLVVMRWG